MKNWHAKRVLNHVSKALCGAALSIAGLAGAHGASAYPDRQITIVVPFPPGGPFDIIARALSVPLASRLGKPVIVENRSGASGMIGTAYVAHAKPDGYTLLLGSSGTQALNQNVFANVPYKSPQDFDPIAELASVPSILMVRPDSPIRNIEEFVAALHAKPGAIMMGNAGAGSVSNQAAMAFLGAVDGKVTAVPYKGTAPALVDLMGGQIDALFDTAVQSLSQVKNGRVRALAVTSASRIASIPDVPTLDESCCKGTSFLIWYGLLGPANLPGDVKETLTKAVLDARSDAQFNATMRAGEAIVPPAAEGTQAFTAKIDKDVALFAELAKKVGVVKE